MADLQELKKEADDLGVSYPKNITAEKLAVKIDAFYEAQETSVMEPVVDEEEQTEDGESTSVEAKKTKAQIALETRLQREREAKETRVVTIVDNDQRVNNHTTTCTVNCSNEFFDLGTIVLPLNEKVEVRMGHIQTLQEVKIPLHVTDPQTGMATVRLRPRYTISFG